MMENVETCERVLNRVLKWRRWFVGWQLGTRPINDPEAAAISDHRELSMLLRIEVNALLSLLVAKGIVTRNEFEEQVKVEALTLDAAYRRRFPGVKTVTDGLALDTNVAHDTMRVMNFRP